MTSLKSRYLIKLISNIINGLINIILVAIVPKALGTIAYGEFSYLFQFYSRFIGFFDNGTSTAFFTKLSADQNRKNLIGYYFLISTGILSISILLIFIFQQLGFQKDIFPNIDEKYIYLGLFSGFLIWFLEIFIKISDSYALTVSVEILKIAYKILSAVILILLINFTFFNLTIYLIFNIFSVALFIFAISILFIKKEIFTKAIWQNIKFQKTSKEFWKYTSPLIVINMINLAVGFFQIWLLQKFGGSEQTGFYGLAYQISAMSFLFTSAMTQIIMREFSKSYGENDITEIRRLFQKYIPMLYSVAGFFAMFLLFQAENLLLIFTDEKFLGAVTVVMLMSFYPIHQTYGQLSSSLYFATERTKQFRNTGFFSTGLSLILSLILLYFLNLGAIGFAITMVVSQFIGTNIQLYFNTKYLEISYFRFLSHQIYSILFFVSISYFAYILGNSETPLQNFLISGAIYTILTIFGTLIFPKIFATSRNELLRLNKKKI